VSLRALWDDSPELRESVKRDLYEWGGAQRGGHPDLGYDRKTNFAVAASKSVSYDADKVDAMDASFMFWGLLVSACGDELAQQSFERERKVIKHYFVGQEPVEAIVQKMGKSRRTVYYILGNAMFRFWAVHYALD
jgi:hypothetical protein